jgi:hypothetical protein
MNDKDKANSDDLLSRAASELNNQVKYMDLSLAYVRKAKLYLDVLEYLISSKEEVLAKKFKKEYDHIRIKADKYNQAWQTYENRYNKIKKGYEILFQKPLLVK